MKFGMKKWMRKLVDQFDLDWSGQQKSGQVTISEETATLLFILDTLNKHLVEVDSQPVRKTREILDEFAKEILICGQTGDKVKSEKVFFRFRQFLGTYRIEEVAYVQKTFDDFRGIIWDFVEQLSAEVFEEQESDLEVRRHFELLKEAVKANSIDDLRSEARQFIDRYVEFQTRRDDKRSERIENIRRNLSAVTKRLSEANRAMAVDHLTRAFNRKSFDEKAKAVWTTFQLEHQVASLVMLDIDHFKRINDTYGHAIGDFALQECVRVLKANFSRESDFVARVGGEEFAVLLPGYSSEAAVQKANAAIEAFRKEWYVHGDLKFQFTISVGVAELQKGEQVGSWVERADMALYKSKNSGRNCLTLAAVPASHEDVA